MKHVENKKYKKSQFFPLKIIHRRGVGLFYFLVQSKILYNVLCRIAGILFTVMSRIVSERKSFVYTQWKKNYQLP